ncbi:MAG: hypothetical protein ISN29_00620 [Gammaproteobacteria bacterium AqS3]|nr:hypothetical protein [Gammaproteobacteria bacterium AqS3]
MINKTIVFDHEIEDILGDLNCPSDSIAAGMRSLGYERGSVEFAPDDGFPPFEASAWVSNGGLLSWEDNHPDNTKRSYNRWRRDFYGYFKCQQRRN